MQGIDKVKSALRGVSFGLLSPFETDGKLDYHGLARNAELLYDRGARTFLASANISEYHALTHEERIQSAETAVEVLPTDATVLAGVGGPVETAIDLVGEYASVGVDAMMIMPPEFTYYHEQGLLAYYNDLGKASNQPLVPYVRDFRPSARYLGALTRIDSVVGIKYAVPDMVLLGEGIGRGDDGVVWVNGMAEPYAVSTWAEGVEGFSAGVSNFRPEIGLALYDALNEQNWKVARQIRDICLPFDSLRDAEGANNTIQGAMSVPVVKVGLEEAGLIGGSVRTPLQPIDGELKAAAKDCYAKLDADIQKLLG